VPQIDVVFEVDASGIVSVSAQDKATGREQQMRITPTSGLAPDEIEELIEEAQGFAESDRIAKEMVILRNKLESLLRNTQKSFAKFGGVLSKNDQEIAERVFKEAEAAISEPGKDAVNKALNALERIASELTAAMLKPASESSKSGAEKTSDEFTKF
jgi:molecular chaperone DnaK